jgi:hypothetical protein
MDQHPAGLTMTEPGDIDTKRLTVAVSHVQWQAVQIAPSSSDGGTEALPCGCVVGGEVVLFHASRRVVEVQGIELMVLAMLDWRRMASDLSNDTSSYYGAIFAPNGHSCNLDRVLKSMSNVSSCIA